MWLVGLRTSPADFLPVQRKEFEGASKGLLLFSAPKVFHSGINLSLLLMENLEMVGWSCSHVGGGNVVSGITWNCI